MTKDEIMILLDICKHNNAWTHYYYGVVEGLRQAREIVGMLDKNNKLSK